MNKPWLERPRTIRLLWIIFIGILALTVIAQVFLHPHGYFGLDGTFGFNAWYGLLSCVAMLFILVPRFGMLGAALATAFAMLVWNLLCWRDARRRLGIDTSILGTLRRG